MSEIREYSRRLIEIAEATGEQNMALRDLGVMFENNVFVRFVLATSGDNHKIKGIDRIFNVSDVKNLGQQ